MTAKSPTAAETRKAFRYAVDAIDLPPEARRIALEAFKSNLRPSVPKRRTRRQEQNQAIRDIQTLSEIMPDLLDQAINVIKRNDFTSGERRHERGELGEMTGTPQPHYGDPTGEEACWDEQLDRTGTIISAMCVAFGQWLTMAETLQDQSNTDVRARAKRTMPDCLACGDQCLDGVRSGFDQKCYRRWVRDGRPDRATFMAFIKKERLEKALASASDVPLP